MSDIKMCSYKSLLQQFSKVYFWGLILTGISPERCENYTSRLADGGNA